MANPESQTGIVGVSIGTSATVLPPFEVCLDLNIGGRSIPLDRILGMLPPGANPSECYLHLHGITAPAEERAEDLTLADNRIIINSISCETRVDDKLVKLTNTEFHLLAHLAQHHKEAQRRSALLRAVWGYGVVTPTRTVDVHVKRIRDKLGAANSYSRDLADVDSGAIRTIRYVGYRGNKEYPKKAA